MDIQNNDVSIQINAKDLAGRKLRISDCDVFIVKVFTTDPRHYLTFSKRDMLMTEFVDELVVPRHQMDQLDSGVVQYTYHYLPVAHDCIYEEDRVEAEGCYNPHHHHGHHPHEDLINSKPVITSIYWRNIKHPHGRPHGPLNTVTLVDLERVHRLIENERITREKDIETLTEQFGEGYSTKLDEEIERSKAEDERIAKALEKLGADLDDFTGNSTDINDKVQGEIIANTQGLKDEVERAVKAEAQLEAAISAETARAKAAEEVNATAIQMEKERATANEGNLGYRIDAVNEKFEAFKTIESNSLSTEVERAKSVESQINTRVDGVVKDLADEVSRAAQKDIEHTNLVSTESNRAQAVENKIATDLETEVNRAKDAEKHILDEVHGVQETVANLATAGNVYSKAEVDNKVNAVKNDVDTINNWIGNHTDNTDELKEKVAGLSADMDKAKADILAEVAKCDAQNGKLATDIQTLSDSTYTKAEIDSTVSNIDSSIAGINNWIANHSDNTDELKTKVANLSDDVDKAKADILAEVAKCDAQNGKLATDIQILSDSVYTKPEVDSKVYAIDASIVALENWKANHIDNTEGLSEKVNKNVTDIQTLVTDLANETTARINADTVIQTKVDVAEGKVDAEIERAKASEKLIADELSDYKTFAETKHSEIETAVADVNANLVIETARAKAAEKVNADAIEIITGDVSTTGSIKKSLADAKDYTDAEIAKLSLAKDTQLADTLAVYAKKTDVDKAITDVIGTAPEALDTLGKISNALSQDSDAITAINGILAGKADSDNVYTKADVDTQVTGVNNSISTLETKVDNADTALTSRIDDLVTKVANVETQAGNDVSAINAALDAEITRAKAAEKANADNLVSEVAKVTDKLNDLNAKVIQDIADSTAKDTEIEANINALNTLVSNVESKVDAEVARATAKDNELVAKDTEIEAKVQVNSDNLASEIARAKQVETELNDKINNINLDGATTAISGVNDKIDSEITRAQAQEAVLATNIQTVSDNLADEIVRAKAAEKANADAIAAIDLTPVKNDVSTLDNKVDIETARAKAAEQANADAIANIQTAVTGANDSISNLSAALTQLQADSQAKDSEIESGLNTEKTRAENAEKSLSDKIDILNGDASTVGSLAHTLHDAEHYTDDEVAKVISALEIHKAEADAKYLTEHQSLGDYYDKATINNIFDGYATKVALSNLAEECARLDEAIKNIDVQDAVEKAVGESEKFADLQTDIDAEVTRAKAAEQEILDSISAVNATLEQAISDLNGMLGNGNGEGAENGDNAGNGISLADLETAIGDAKSEMVAYVQSEKLVILESANTQAQNLVNAAKTEIAETVYTKEEVDAKFMQVKPISEDDYDDLVEAGEVDENVLYILI